MPNSNEGSCRTPKTIAHMTGAVTRFTTRSRTSPQLPVPRLSRTALVTAVAVCSISLPLFGYLETSSASDSPQTATPTTVADSSLAEVKDIHIVATEFRFGQPAIDVAAGQTLRLTLDDQGTIEHNVHLDLSSGSVDLVAGPGQTSTTTLTAPGPGEYTFFCSIPGHAEAGMKGTLKTVDASTPHVGHAARATGDAEDSNGSMIQPLPLGLSRLPQPLVPSPLAPRDPTTVKVDLETREVTALLDDGIAYHFWTFGGTVPGPMIRVRQGDLVELTLKNAPDTALTHSINLHAVNGPGGGSVDTQVAPGNDGTIRFRALHAGVYVYHCMTPMVGQHVANGMYGMIVVEPPEGLPPVDHEYYLMQGDFYLKGDRDVQGLREFSLDKLLAEQPDYVVYNGSAGSLTGERALTARVGETVRFFFGVGGPNRDSAFHVVGESFDSLHPEGSTEAVHDVQTTLVPPGGASMAEMKLSVPGHYMIEDHHITRLQRGAMADFEVSGEPNLDVFTAMGHAPARNVSAASVSPARAANGITVDSAAPAGTVEVAAGWRTVFDEHFLNGVRNAWPQGSTAWLGDASYHLFARDPGRFVAAGAPIHGVAGDVAVSGTFRKLGGPNGGGYGFIVRDRAPELHEGHAQDGDFVVLEVGDRGEVGVWRRSLDKWVEVVPWTHASAVHTGNDANQVLVQAVGTTLSLIVNGVSVATAPGPDAGSAGLGIGVFAGGDMNEVALESMTVQVPAH
jgi:nitrite reductase (NO-forming)